MKNHDTKQVKNELNQSKFFLTNPQIRKDKQQEKTVVPEREQRVEKANTKEPTRTLKRASHDLYIDQMQTLSTKTKGYFLAKGETKSNAQMIREAVDEYIKKYQ